MRWECGECGHRLTRERPPAVCRECGRAGACFVRADDAAVDHPELGAMRELWLRAGWESRGFRREAAA